MRLNRLQMTAFALIQSDARFLYTLIDIQKNAHRIDSNYIMMSQPYIGVFTDGAAQWANKAGLTAPTFNKEENQYYVALRQGHKLFERTYAEYSQLLMEKLRESDLYFYNERSPVEKLIGYYNVGTDLCKKEYCGNTILCAMYSPIAALNDPNTGAHIRDISIIAGKLAAFYRCSDFPPYQYNDSVVVKYKDYHFFKNCPLKTKTTLGFVLFSILCSVNFVTVFVNQYFSEEIPQKLKFAYLQYYYLCDFIQDLNHVNGTHFYIDDTLQNREFRNCLAHYGLSQFIDEREIIEGDVLKGLTLKAFDADYTSVKDRIYKYLNDLCVQIKREILYD